MVPSGEAAPVLRLEMRQLFFDIIKTLVLAAALFFVVQTLVQNYQVFGASMEPNLHSGDHLIVNKAAYMSLDMGSISKFIPFYEADDDSKLFIFGEPKRGDVVIIKAPFPPPDRLIKRIVGLPGDTVEIKTGILYINGFPVSESYVLGAPPSLTLVEVPEAHYYVLGDNRTRSNDSRFFGSIPRSDIVGKAWIAYWPLGLLGIVDSFSGEVDLTP